MPGRIRIAAALIDDGEGRLLFVRKRGSGIFMLAGGKMEPGESAAAALVRELGEELGFRPDADELRFLGRFSAKAANEPGFVVEAQLFHLRAPGRTFAIAAELEEAVWRSIDEAEGLPLAPLAREQVLPLARRLMGTGDPVSPR